MCKIAHEKRKQQLCRLLMYEVFERAGFSDADVAEHLGGTAKTAEHYRLGTTTPSLSVFLALIALARPVETVQRVAALAGCVAVPLPDVDAGEGGAIERVAAVLREAGDLGKELGVALADGSLDDREIRRLIDELDDVGRAVVAGQEYLRGMLEGKKKVGA